MTLNEMHSAIIKECNKYTHCEDCPLYDKPCASRKYDTVKNNYELIFPKNKDEKGEDNMENYAMINGEKIELDDETIRMIKNSTINHKKYYIGNITITPNWDNGYVKDAEDFGDGSILIREFDNGDNYSETVSITHEDVSITHEELPKIIEALTEINNYLQGGVK